MFKFNASDYRNFVYGIVPKNLLRKKRMHPFRLWGEDLILFWNNGEVRCYQNACPHYGLPLNQGVILKNELECGFHSWRFQLSDGKLINAPMAKKQPKCALTSFKAFIKGGIVFVYVGDESELDKAKDYLIDEVIENPHSAAAVYEVPFYLAMNSSMDFPHHASHSFFYKLYSIYRFFSLEKNPLKTNYTPVMQEETDHFYKFKIKENGVELTVYPFCSQYNDLIAKNKWQVFVTPIDNNSSQYLINIQSLSKNPLYRLLTYLAFHTVIRFIAMPEDQKWLKSSFANFKTGTNINLCDQDFGLRAYLRKFFISSNPKN